MIKYYIIQGKIDEIRPVEKYGCTFKNIIVGDKYIHMAKGATWSKDDIQVGDEVAVTCFNNSITDENGVPYITGIAVTWLGGKRITTNYDYIQESDVNRLAYLMCDMMDCRKCPVDHGNGCTEKLKEWLKEPVGNIQNTQICPVCGKRVERVFLASLPEKYVVRCGCATSGSQPTQEEAYSAWRIARNLKAASDTLEEQ